jgi:hypothetical protein
MVVVDAVIDRCIDIIQLYAGESDPHFTDAVTYVQLVM